MNSRIPQNKVLFKKMRFKGAFFIAQRFLKNNVLPQVPCSMVDNKDVQ